MNILLIFSDQQHRYSLGCMGNPEVHTPNLDALAGRGVLMRRCYSNDPVCGPFRGSLMMGEYTSRCGVTQNGAPLPTDRPTLADAFNAGDYHTGFVGKWHLGGNGAGPIASELRGGFTEFVGYQCYNGFRDDVVFHDEDGQPRQFDIHRTDATTEIAIEKLRKMAPGPFFLLVGYQAPHYPVQPSPEFDTLYAGKPITRRPNAVDADIDPFTRTWSPRSPWPPEDDPNFQRYGGDLEEYIRLYYGMCSQIDANVGRLLAELERLGLADDTAVFYTSDHGDMQGSHNLKNKCLPYEESAGIPLIAHVPSGATGVISDGLVSGVDFMPTCLDLASVPMPDGRDGVSFARTLLGQPQKLEGPVFSERENQWCMICSGPWKLVANRSGGALKPTMLFNLTEDPYEMRNLLEAGQAADIGATLLADLQRWQDYVTRAQ
jgi:arylsulfatase A-like enzyme